jgi:GGDEF domain-containing protein
MTDGGTERGGLALICEIGATITSSMVLEDVLTAVAQKVAEAFAVWECDFYRYDPARRTLLAAACWCLERSPVDDDWVGCESGVDDDPSLRRVIEERCIVQEHRDDPDLSVEDQVLMDEWGEKTAVSVPLVFEERVIGCLTLIEKRAVRRFSAEEQELLRALALPAAVAIHNAEVYRELEDRARQLDSLLEASRALASTVALEDVLTTVARTVGEALDVPSSLIYEYERETDSLVWRSEYNGEGRESEDKVGERYALQEYPDDRVVLEGDAIVEQHADDPTLDAVTRQSMIDNGELSCLTVPVKFEGEPLGLVEIVETRSDRSFTPGEIDLARGLAEQAAVAIHKARLYRRLEEQNARLSAFVGLSETMGALATEDEMLHDLGRVMSEVLDYRQWAAYMHEPDEHEFRVVTSVGDAEDIEAGQTGRRVPGRVMDRLVAAATLLSRSFFVDSRRHTWTAEEHCWFPSESLGDRRADEWGTDDTLLVPMRADSGGLLGYIEAYDPADKQLPTEEDVRLLEVFAARAASSIELHRLHELLAEQARTDGLTGLANHRHFMERLDQEVATARRYGTPLSLLMLDLDDFKPFNDRYGHPQGDKLLRRVAAILCGSTRDKVDLVARYGGEEFVVLLPSTPAAGAEAAGERLAQGVAGDRRDAVAVAERIRRAMAETAFEGHPDRADARVTVSVGVATFPEHASDGHGLVVAADKALYVAKRSGKDRVRLYE